MNSALNEKLNAIRVQLEAGPGEDKLEVAKAALRDIVQGCERRLRKGHDEGDASTLGIAKAALKKIAS